MSCLYDAPGLKAFEIMKAYMPYRRFDEKQKRSFISEKIPIKVHQEPLDASQCAVSYEGTSVVHAPWHSKNMFMVLNYNVFRILSLVMLLKNNTGNN